MGEYAYNSTGERIKIGTCESMYYLRFEDRRKVRPDTGSVDPATTKGLFFRLPFPDEDHVPPGNYEPFDRGALLARDFSVEGIEPGNIQLKHECGLLTNVPCHHGIKLPNLGEARTFWNGKSPYFWELCALKSIRDDTVMPVFRCRYCRKMYSTTEWHEIAPHIMDDKLRERLIVYVTAC